MPAKKNTEFAANVNSFYKFMSLLDQYNSTIKPELKKELGIANPLAVPKLVKIVVNTGLGEALADRKLLDKVAEQLAVITGQKPLATTAKVSISTFKLRAGEKIGLKVTLRGKRMYEFLEKLIRIALPRVRDFRGVSTRGFDNQGNYSLGIREQIIFPEINPDKVSKVFGMNITFVTTAKTDKEGKALLKFMGMPFRN